MTQMLTLILSEGSTFFGCFFDISIYRYMQYLQQLPAEMNMEYITLDIGAAINTYKVLWSYPNIFKNIVIHLGDFHFMKENFKVIGNLFVHQVV